MIPETEAEPIGGAMPPAPMEPMASPGLSLTLTFLPDGRVKLSEPFEAEAEASEPMPAPGMSPADGEMAESEERPTESGHTFETLNEAVKFLVQVAETQGPAGSEEEGMIDGYGGNAKEMGGEA